MKIEVGDWIRSKDGYIGKVKKISYDNMEKCNYYICEKDNVMTSNYLENISKYSKNIIDLIELYDYVNGFLVFDIITYVDGTRQIKLTNGTLLQNKNIEKILTHEQYEANCYKV